MYLEDPEFKEWFKKAKVGDAYTYSTKSACNYCSGLVYKHSDTEVRDLGISGCTLLACNTGTIIQVK